MREKELRLALICYGGISLAVYMHGITKEVWRLARASRAHHAGDNAGEVGGDGSEAVYRRLIAGIGSETDVRLRVLVDIVAGASAGGINGVFLAQAIATGQSLEPLTALWLDGADVEVLIDPDARPWSRFSKMWASPIAWWAAGRRGGTVERTVEAGSRDEVRAKLSTFVRARWFAPPFDGAGFTRLLLDAFDAMARTAAGPALLPDAHPLDLIVTVTDFQGHPERLRLHSPPEVVETEHRLSLAFQDKGSGGRILADPAELVFASRATASFPGAFPPFTVAELDTVLAARRQAWPGRNAFLARVLPRQAAVGTAEATVLIDGSVLANAPFRPAIDALRDRPARREVDRRFVYIDPKPGVRSVGLGSGREPVPGFFATIFGALSDIPREQPIRDNLEAIEARSTRISRMRAIVEAIRPEVEKAIVELFGRPLFLDRPTPARLATWRARAQDRAAKGAGYAYASYGHLKLSGVVDEVAAVLAALGDTRQSAAALRDAIRAGGIDDVGALSGSGASDAAILFFRKHDLGFRIRRLRFLARRVAEIEDRDDCPRAAIQAAREAVYGGLAPYLDRQRPGFHPPHPPADAAAALDWLAAARDLPTIDEQGEARIAEALAGLPRGARRTMLLAYLGFPFYDIATLPLLQGEGLDEFDPVKVDRIAPDDARAIREGGAEASLKGIQFNSFGAFFSRAYRENDYLWGRLHGGERLIDIVVSALPEGKALPAGAVAGYKRDLFRAILAEERTRLTAIPELFEALAKEVG